MNLHQRIRGCMLGGAVGDALGAAVEFMSLQQIRRSFGPEGIRDYAPAYGRLGAITDDTQMALFTAEGMLRAYHRWSSKGMCHAQSVVRYAYLRWLATQDPSYQPFDPEPGSWLLKDRRLHAVRAPGKTCLTALRQTEGSGAARNESRGCGGVMRVAPCGLFAASLRQGPESAFEFGVESARITHHHPTGYLASGAFSALVFGLASGESLETASQHARQMLTGFDGHEEALKAIKDAEELALSGEPPNPELVAKLGEGWTAGEALAIALYCAWVAPDFESGVQLAVNHGGDSDSTGAMAGNLLGLRFGESGIPERWLQPLELRDVITQVADDLYVAGLSEFSPNWENKNPAARAFWDRYLPT